MQNQQLSHVMGVFLFYAYSSYKEVLEILRFIRIGPKI